MWTQQEKAGNLVAKLIMNKASNPHLHRVAQSAAISVKLDEVLRRLEPANLWRDRIELVEQTCTRERALLQVPMKVRLPLPTSLSLWSL